MHTRPMAHSRKRRESKDDTCNIDKCNSISILRQRGSARDALGLKASSKSLDALGFEGEQHTTLAPCGTAPTRRCSGHATPLSAATGPRSGCGSGVAARLGLIVAGVAFAAAQDESTRSAWRRGACRRDRVQRRRRSLLEYRDTSCLSHHSLCYAEISQNVFTVSVNPKTKR